MNIEQLKKAVGILIRPIKTKVLLMVAHGLIEATKDSDELQKLQATFLAGETKNDVRKMHHFGFSSHAPKGSECIGISVGGNRESLVIIASENRQYRFKDLGEGEVAIYSQSGDFIHFKKDNEIEVSTKNLVINASDDVTVNATNKVTVNTKTADVNATTATNITSPTTKIDGDLTVTGDVTAEKSVNVTENVLATGNVTGAVVTGQTSVLSALIASSLSMTVAGTELKDYQTHTHDYQDTGNTVNPQTTQGVN